MDGMTTCKNLRVKYLSLKIIVLSVFWDISYLSGCKTLDRDGKKEFLIIVSFNKPEQAMMAYKQRWQVETLFKALKSSGFDI